VGYSALTGIAWLATAFVALAIGDAQNGSTLAWVLLAESVGASLIIGVLSHRRLHDLNLSGWLILLVLVVGPLFSVGLMCAPGSARANRFGPAPGPNPPWLQPTQKC
jgi:uncharacterized membrane protein YhaH (DUF805 family)